jgi:hypothetical protein
MRPAISLFVLFFGTASLPAADSPSILTGWFADEQCATARVAAGRIGPTGQACARECLRKGVPMAFIDEKGKAVLRVDNPGIVAGRECDHVQIEAVRKDAKTLHVTSVRVLEKYAAKCDAN